MEYKGLPVYNVNIEAQDEEFLGLTCVSIVSDPAVCEQLYCFNKVEKKQMIFTSDNNEQHCITSVALLSDTPIFRIDEYGNGYYIVFEKQTIRDLVEKYSKDGYNNITSFQHDGNEIDDFVMIESYFVDKENGVINNKFDVPDGSWIVTYKCTNEETWNKVKSELSTGGYSVEIICDITPAKDGQHIEEEPESNDDYEMNSEVEDWLMELLAWLEDEDMEIVMSSQKKKLVFDYITSGTIKDILADKAAVYDVELNNGKHMICQIFAITNNGDSFEVMTADKPDGKNTWHNIKNSDVNKITKTSYPYLPFDYEAPSYKAYINDKSITTNQTITAPVATIDDCINNRRLVIINYNDDLENPHTQARQCAILAHGLTKLGNECVRVRELYGDSRSVSEGVEGAEVPGYRLMLTKRIRQMRVVDYAKPWDDSILDGDYNYSGDDGMEIIYNYYKG